MNKDPTRSTSMACPKCGSSMTAYERNGITIDQCGGCRGIFLDRGELEHLIDAEATYLKMTPADRYRQPYPGERDRGGHHGSQRGRLSGLFD